MPDENQQPLANGGYISADGIYWESVGKIEEFMLGVSSELDELTGRLSKDLCRLSAELGRITFKTPWWQDFSPIYKLIGIPRPYRSRYTVPMLRRNGKSHRGCR